jgi:aldehyde:ferredoxin oxidoreductase
MSPKVSTIIKDGSVCDFHKRTQNYGYVSVWECTNQYRRNLPAYNAVITCIGSAGLRQGDEKSPGVSTIIKDGSVCDFHKQIQNWEFTSTRDYMARRRRIITTYNMLVMCIGGAGLHHW